MPSFRDADGVDSGARLDIELGDIDFAAKDATCLQFRTLASISIQDTYEEVITTTGQRIRNLADPFNLSSR